MEWVQLKARKHIERNGVLETHAAADWVQVGGQTAEQWEADGVIEPRMKPAFPGRRPDGSLGLPLATGIVAMQGSEEQIRLLLGQQYPDMQVLAGTPHLPFERTMLWDAAYGMPVEFLSIGYHLLSQWQLAVPLMNYKKLASSFGTVDERIELKKVIPDLRMLVYDPRCVFLRKCRDMQDLLDRWLAYEGDPRLGFLKAVYEVKPLVNALPTTWGKRSKRDG